MTSDLRSDQFRYPKTRLDKMIIYVTDLWLKIDIDTKGISTFSRSLKCYVNIRISD